MPDFKLQNQPFDLAFHPSQPIVYLSLLTGEVKALTYDDTTGDMELKWSVRHTKKCARTLDVTADGTQVWMAGKAGGIFALDAMTGDLKVEISEAHSAPINRIFHYLPGQFATGDDEGQIKLWNTKKLEAERTYGHHWDYISGFAWLEDKKHLVVTSGDGHLSVLDVRSSKSTPLAMSEDQEDELLSIAPIKGGTKYICGSGEGILSVWNRSKGWGDCVDRIPGHPASIDAVVSLTPDVIATGSEDGMIRVMQILPTKFLGVIASHSEFPIERIKLDRNNKWLGSVSHDDCIKLTDVEDLFEESDSENEGEEEEEEETEMEGVEESNAEEGSDGEVDESEAMEEDSDDEEERRAEEKRRKRKEKKQEKKKGGLGDLGAGGQTEAQESGFFDEL